LPVSVSKSNSSNLASTASYPVFASASVVVALNAAIAVSISTSFASAAVF
jgi:hypothetical protein